MQINEELKKSIDSYKKCFSSFGCTDSDFEIKETKKGYFQLFCTKEIEDPPKVGLPFVFDKNGRILTDWDEVFDALG